jgi:hypothetical protein
MAQPASTRDVFAGSFENKRLLLIQFLANPILFTLFALWLLIPEARTWELILNAVLILAIVVAAVVLHAGTLNYFCDRSKTGEATLKPAFARALRHVLAIALWIAVFYLIWELWGKLEQNRDALLTYFRSILPAPLRRLISLRAFTTMFEIKMFVYRWIITPGILLPLAVQAADRGFRGLGRSGWVALKTAIWSLRYWATMTLAAVVGVYFSGLILNWQSHSQNSTFAGETTSLVLRLLAAYLLGLFSWMLACSLVGRSCGLRQGARGNSTP